MKKMKLIYSIFIIMAMAVLLVCCGCSRNETGAAAPEGVSATAANRGEAQVSDHDDGSGTVSNHGTFDTMAEIRIEADGVPGEEYIEAEASAVWTGCELTDEPVTIKLRGNSSKESDKKSYTIKFEDELAFMGMDAGKKWALNGNPFDKSLLRLAVGFDYAQAIGIDYTPETRLCKVWLNDRYMGVYTAVEPIEAGEGKVEIDPDSGDFLLERNNGREEDDVMYIRSSAGLRFEMNEPEEPTEEQIRTCSKLLKKAERAIFACDHKEYEKYIDVESFVNFYIFNEVIKDVDFGEYSTRYYFKDGILYAGPPWDLDLSQGNVSAEKGEGKYTLYNNGIGTGDESGDSTHGLWCDVSDYYYWLCQDKWFMKQVDKRWKEVSATTENLAEGNKLGDSLIDRYMAAHGDELAGNYKQGGYVSSSDTSADGVSGSSIPDGRGNAWIIDQPDSRSEYQHPAADYEGNVQMLRQWLADRKDYLDGIF